MRVSFPHVRLFVKEFFTQQSDILFLQRYSLGSEIESCCDASAVCCSINDAKIESVQDMTQACCSTVDAKIESVADIAAVCCSITDAKIESVVDMLEECCSASEECCSLLDAKIESVTDRLEECCSASEECCSVLDVKIYSLTDAVLQSALDCCANTEAQSASCCDAIRQMAEECCSANEALTLSCCDAVLESALDCCSANEALMLSCCEITEQCCSQSEALLSCCEEAAQCCSVNEALLHSCCDASLQCCSLVDAKIESCCEASAECCSVLDAKIESVQDAAAECCSQADALALSCCEEAESRLDELENAIGIVEGELLNQELRIEDLELITGSSVTTVITADRVFTSDMLPKADETRIIKFAPEFQGRNNTLITLTIDPDVLDDGGLITLPTRSRLQFEGLGVVEILDGVTFNFQGSLAPRTRICVLEGTGMMGTGREDWPELMFAEAVAAIADGATVKFGGEGSGFISIRQGAQLLVNMDSHVIFGDNSDAELDILFDENSMLTIDHPAALVTFQNATFDIVFDQNSECTIAQGCCEFNSNQGIYAPGFIRKLYMIGASTLNVQRLDNNAGRLELAPNIDNSVIDFDNENGTITGEGDIRYRSFDAQAVDSTLQIQPRNVAGIYAASELFIGLAALQEAALEDVIQVQLGTLGNDSSGHVGQEIVGQAGNPAALCPELSTLPGFEQRSGRIVKLQVGDSSLFYDISVPGGPFNVVSGLNGLGNVFRILNCDEATRV